MEQKENENLIEKINRESKELWENPIFQYALEEAKILRCDYEFMVRDYADHMLGIKASDNRDWTKAVQIKC